MENTREKFKRSTGNYDRITYQRRTIQYLFFAVIVTILVALISELRIDQYMEGWMTSLWSEGNFAVTQMAVTIAHTEVIILLSIGIMAVLIISGLKTWAFFYFRLMFFGCFLAYILKEGISRPRPMEVISTNLWQIGVESISQSFPSGHVMKITFLIAFFVILYMVKINKEIPMGLLALGGTLIILVGLGQILNGRHFFTDTMGGYFWAVSWVYGNLYLESIRKDKGIFGGSILRENPGLVFQKK